MLTFLMQRPPPTWQTGSSYVPPSQRPSYGQSPLQVLQAQPNQSPVMRHDDMTPEEEDSDVSVDRVSSSYRPFGYGSRPVTSAGPVVVTPAPPSSQLVSQEAINRRLTELSRMEDQNSAKNRELKPKRERMDARIRAKRDAQDRKIQAIMEARQRRDNRIGARRGREDVEFQRVFDQIEQEEEGLRRRLKRLKRGLPLEDSPQITQRSISPPGPAYSTIPPPAKRHQANPPGQNNSPALSGAPTPVSQAPSYSFYGGPRSSGGPPHYSTIPPPTATTPSNAGPPPGSVQAAGDRLGSVLSGSAASPLAKSPLPASGNLSTAPPPRSISSSYDTRPPPPASSGFATVNAPPTSGFATVNSRPPQLTTTTQPGPPRPEEQRPPPVSTYSDPDKPSSNSSTPVAGKRTPSTTHPYQMSEAFANRHHHCERVDELNRGIWTSHGPGGTHEHPTGPPVQMYLRCNHDGCRRIDWRTVHGLQCHIVKSHEQPKGTIGSLEKALDRYGVPVKEVEDHERQHGDGTGGTMADPKSTRVRKPKDTTPYVMDPNVRPAGYKPSPTASPSAIHSVPPYGHGPPMNGPPPEQNRPSGPHAPMTSTWNSINVHSSPYGPPRPPIDTSKQLQGDAVMKDAISATPSLSTPTPSTAGSQQKQPFTVRPFEYPSKAPPVMPAAAPAKSPSTQNSPASRVLPTAPKATVQSPPRAFTSSWSSRPIWGTDLRVVESTAPIAPAKQEEQAKAERKVETKPAESMAALSAAPPLAAAVHPVRKPETNATTEAIRSPIQAPRPNGPETPVNATVPSTQQGPPQTEAATKAPAQSTEAKDSAHTVSSPRVPGAMVPPISTATTSGPAFSTRSAQSPSVSKAPSAPSSVRRTSRRSSVAVSTGSNNNLPQTDVLANATASEKGQAQDAEGTKKGEDTKGTAAPTEKPAEKDNVMDTKPPAAAETPSKTVVNGGNDADDDDDDSQLIVVGAADPKSSDKQPDNTKVADIKDKDKEHENAVTSGRASAASSVKGSVTEEKEAKEAKKKDSRSSVREKEKMELRTPPPRRAASGRVTRKSTFG